MKSALVVLLAVSSTACSGVKVAYGLADNMVESWVSERLDLDDETEELASQQIDAFFRWHRRTMLPRYAQFMRREATIHANAKFNRTTFNTSAIDAKQLWDDTVRGALGGVAVVLERQTPQQIAYMRTQMTERNEELEEKYSRPREEMVAEGKERVVEGFELFIGDLNDAQLRIIDEHSRSFNADPKYWLRNRTRRNQAFLGFMANRPAKADISEFLEEWLLEPHIYADPGYKSFSDDVRRRVEDMIFDVLAAMTAEQRTEFVDTMRSYADDLSDLVT